MSNIINTFYDTSAKIGQVESTINLWIGGSLAVVLILSAICLFINGMNMVNTTGTITSVPNCIQIQQNGKTQQQCSVYITYSANGKQYNSNINVNGDNYKIGETIHITYDSKNPGDVFQQQQVSESMFASILCGLAVLIFVGVYVHYFLTSRYKMFAAVEGVETEENFVKNFF